MIPEGMDTLAHVEWIEATKKTMHGWMKIRRVLIPDDKIYIKCPRCGNEDDEKMKVVTKHHDSRTVTLIGWACMDCEEPVT